MAKEKLHPALIKESKKTIDEAIQKLNDFGKVFVDLLVLVRHIC